MARPLAARWSRRALVGAFSLLVALPALPGAGAADPDVGLPVEAVNSNFELVGHNPLGNRGMNAALAIHGNYAYVGSRTDGKANNANHAGIMVIDISNPASPTTVKEIGPPLEANQGESSRELRVWESQEILIVLHTNCGIELHLCSAPSVNYFRFYDVSGANAADPKPITTLNHNTHEFFLWQDPFDPDRALMFGGPGSGTSMPVWDLSPLTEGQPPVRIFNGTSGYTSGGLHSLSVSNDGTRAYLALLTGGFAVIDVSAFARGDASPAAVRVTGSSSRPTWSGPGAHSAVKLWGKDWVIVQDEVYSEALKALGHGCPWGWARMIDISDPTKPVVRSEYKMPQNDPAFCTSDVPRPSTSFSAHNPTATPSLVITSWHAGGVQVIDVTDPSKPVQVGEFIPGLDQRPPVVLQEDLILSAGHDKVAMWSYPIIRDGLIYVTDIRNGLYVLRYTGPHAAEVSDIDFLEGNSNLGDALLFEPVDPCAPSNPSPPDTCP